MKWYPILIFSKDLTLYLLLIILLLLYNCHFIIQWSYILNFCIMSPVLLRSEDCTFSRKSHGALWVGIIGGDVCGFLQEVLAILTLTCKYLCFSLIIQGDKYFLFPLKTRWHRGSCIDVDEIPATSSMHLSCWNYWRWGIKKFGMVL
jgi:hypothetical protein